MHFELAAIDGNRHLMNILLVSIQRFYQDDSVCDGPNGQ